MVRSVRGALAFAMLGMLLGTLLAVGATAQTPPTGPAKGPGSESAKPPVKDNGRTTLDKMKFPPGSIPVIVEDLKDALSSFPRWILLKPEDYQQLLDRIANLERQLKDKNTPFACKLTGRLKDDQLHLQAQYLFATSQPKTTIVLGLQGGHLIDEGELDAQAPILDYTDEGYVVKVDKPGTHQLVLHLRAPVGLKKTGTAGAGVERSVELGLPGAAVTTLALELPPAVKEIRCNETPEKARTAGHWELALGRIKNLALSWKEPATIPGGDPLLVSDTQVVVKLEETFALATAEMTLEDLRGSTTKWQLLLPPQATVEQIKTSGNALVKHIPPNGGNAAHVIQDVPAGEVVLVSVKVWTSRPFKTPRLPIGPFLVLGPSKHQQGTIAIKTTPEAIRGQRLVYHRHGETLQSDAAGGASTDTVAAFKYSIGSPVAAKPKGPAPKAPLELELKTEKSQAEAWADHVLRIRRMPDGWNVDAITKIKVRSLHAGVDYVDVQLPRRRPEGALLLGGTGGFPAAVPWAPFLLGLSRSWPVLVPLEYACEGEAGAPVPELTLADVGTRRGRIKFSRVPPKEFVVTLKGRYTLPGDMHWANLELPRPLVFFDRGGQVAATIEEGWELLVPRPGSLEPAPDRQRHTVVSEQAPAAVELAWRPYRPEFPVAASAEIMLSDRLARVRQEMTLPPLPLGGWTPKIPPLPPRAKDASQVGQGVLLHVPADARNLSLELAGKSQPLRVEKETAWISLPAEGSQEPVVLTYDFAVPAAEAGQGAGKARTFSVPLLRPDLATRLDVTVRVWSEPGVVPSLAEAGLAAAWEERAPRPVARHEAMPSLVLHAVGVRLPLALKVEESSLTPLAKAIIDRGLIQVSVQEDGSQHYRARFLVRKFHSKFLDLELPHGAEALSIAMDGPKVSNWSTRATEPNPVIRFQLDPEYYAQPVLLEIDYRRRAGDDRFGQTLLRPPQFRSEVLLGQVRWQLSLPSSWTAVVPEGQPLEQRWGLQGWLLAPQSALSGADLEHWLSGKEGGDPSSPVSLALWRNSLEPLRVLHLPRQMWLMVCSGLFVAIGLGLVFAPLARVAFWLVLVVLSLALVAAGILWPMVLPILLYGCQPGAVVFALILIVQWFLQERYRRQVVFMPGFTRLRPGSSLLRGSSARAREPSTVDAPPPSGVGAGSSINQKT